MKCPNCGGEIPINQRYCAVCGQKVEVSFDFISDSVQVDASVRRGRQLEEGMKFLIAVLLLLIILVYLYNNYRSVTPVADAEPYMPSAQATLGDVAYEAPVMRPLEGLPIPKVNIPSVGTSAPRIFGFRRGKTKQQLIKVRGGDDKTQTAVRKGLAWLSHAQQTLGRGDGGWSVSRGGGRAKLSDVGVTGLALMAFLADGHVWVELEDGKVPEFGDTVKKGIHWLVYNQQPDGLLAVRKDGKYNYSHAMATQALVEALAMSGDTRLRNAAEKAVKFVIAGQQDNGGWNYTNAPGTGRADTSITGWQVMALASARRAGIEVPGVVFRKAIGWFDSVTQPRTSRTGYEKRPVSAGTGRMLPRQYYSTTAISLLCRRASGLSQERSLLLRQASLLKGKLPEWGASWKPGTSRKRVDLYYWYHATEALFLMGGLHWERWNLHLKKALLGTQDTHGFWREDTLWGREGGKVYTTSLAVLCLTAYYRHP